MSNEKSQNKPFKMVAVYPREGNFWTQHPVAILKEEWVTEEKREASAQFIEYLLTKDAQTKAMKLGLRPILPDIALAAPFDDEHGVKIDIAGTKQYKVPEERVLKRIRDLWEEVKVPATVVLVIDRSGSMQGDPMDNAKTGAVEFIKNMKPRDQLMVLTFSDSVSNTVDLCSVRKCGERAIGLVQGIFAEGGTALHDTIAVSYEKLKAMKKADPRRRYCVIVLSDGKDTASTRSRSAFLDLAAARRGV